MKTLKIVGIGLAVIVALFLTVAAALPSRVHVERTIVIDAPPDQVFQQVNDLRRWKTWSPWYTAEPNADYFFSGSDSGVGQIAKWKGQAIGQGSQTIVESVPGELITTRLEFVGQRDAMSSWRFEPIENGTRVTWMFDTTVGYPAGRYVGILTRSVLGRGYEQGLAGLKASCEKKA